MVHVVSFSGGKDSTAMLLMMIERKMPIDYIVFVDTTKDFPQMYEHIDRVAEHIKPLEITRLSFDFDYWFGEHIKTKGKRKGTKGYGWADSRSRWCTGLKRDTVLRFIKKLDSPIEYHGIASDEKHRAKNNSGRDIRYPLIDWGITERQALAYCYNRGFTWDGLYEKFARLSCYCCPLSRIGELKTVHDDFPDLWRNMKKMDTKSWRSFNKDYTLDDLEQRFDLENEIDRLQMRLL